MKAWRSALPVMVGLASLLNSAAALGETVPAERGSAPAPNALITEYQFKITWVAKFTNFVRWPDACTDTTDAAFRIGILGRPRGASDPFPDELWGIEQVLDGRRLDVVRVRTLATDGVQRAEQLRALRDCHVVFICWSERRLFDVILPHLAGSCAFTVSDVAGFAERGGMLTLTVPQGSTASLTANLAATRAAGLSIRPDVLKLRGSRIVEGAVPEPVAPKPDERDPNGSVEP